MEALATWVLALMALTVTGAEARNYPCSGKKGGVSHCYNGKFICRDGTMSASKRTCTRGTEAD